MAREGEKGARRLAEAARAARARAAPEAAGSPPVAAAGPWTCSGARSGGATSSRCLTLHLIAREPAYGNRLIEEIEAITDGIISVNPNTIYPLLRDLEARGLIEGQWEHPDRRTRRFYSITAAGRKEYRRLVAELEPFLDSVIRSVTLIKREIYG